MGIFQKVIDKSTNGGTINSSHRPKRIYCDESKELTIELVEELITEHKGMLVRYKQLEAMYYGEMAIDDMPTKEPWKPDNRVATPFPKYIVDTFMGYFIGKPVKITHSNDRIQEKLSEFDNLNNVEDKNFELAKWACIYGNSIELIYQNEETQTRTATLKPTEAFIVYDNSIEPKPLYGVWYGNNDDNKQVGTIYTRTDIKDFIENKFIEEKPHPYPSVPMNEYVHNTEMMGIFEPVIPIINQLNKAISAKANDVDYFAEAYLAFIGGRLDLDDEKLKNIRENRVINYESDGVSSNSVDVKFLDKPNADGTQENLIDRLEQWLYQTSMVANISDESFGNSSGTSLAYKLQSMSNLALNMQRKLRASLQERYRLFFSLETNINKADAESYADIEYTFDRNIPRNLLEESQIMQNVDGITSKETQLGVFSRIDNVKSEVDRIEKEESSLNSRKDIYQEVVIDNSEKVAELNDETD